MERRLLFPQKADDILYSIATLSSMSAQRCVSSSMDTALSVAVIKPQGVLLSDKACRVYQFKVTSLLNVLTDTADSN